MQCTINTRNTVPLADIKPGECFAVEIRHTVEPFAFVAALALDPGGKPYDPADALDHLVAGRTDPISLSIKARVERYYARNDRQLLVSVVAVPATAGKFRTGMLISMHRDWRVTPVAPTQPIAFAALEGAA